MDDTVSASLDDTLFDGRSAAYWKKRTLAVVLLVFVLVIQGAYAARPQPQPYPAVVLPGFRQTTTDWRSEFAEADVKIRYEDGTVLSPAMHELFTNFNDASIPPTIDYAFRPNESDIGEPISKAVKDWLNTKASALYPASRVRSVRFCWRTATIDVRGPSSSDAGCDRVREVTFD